MLNLRLNKAIFGKHRKRIMKKIFAVFLVLVLISGCSKKEGYQTTKSGIKYVEDTVGTGTEAKAGDLVTVNYSAWIVRDNSNLFGDWEKDSTKSKDLLFSTKLIGQPKKIVLGTNMLIKGSDGGIMGMKVGGVRTMVIPYKLAYGKEGANGIPSNTDIKLQVKLLDVKVSTGSTEWGYDSTKVKSTKDGLRYVILKEGVGPKPVSGQAVVMNYSGYLSNGHKFDSSFDREEAVMFRIGMNQVIPGLEEGIKLLNKGAKAKFFIPPSLAYGDRTMGEIPPYSTLTFDVEVIDIK